MEDAGADWGDAARPADAADALDGQGGYGMFRGPPAAMEEAADSASGEPGSDLMEVEPEARRTTAAPGTAGLREDLPGPGVGEREEPAAGGGPLSQRQCDRRGWDTATARATR